MFCFCKNLKIKKELKEFKDFKKTFKYEYKEIKEKNGIKFIGDDIVVDKDGNTVAETENWINAGFKLHGALPKVISNLFPYEFTFRGVKVKSIESIFQSLRFKDKKTQKLIFNLHGMPSNVVKVATDYNWKETYMLYFQGKTFHRESKEFDDFIDEMYISALQNPLYRGVLSKIDKQIIHSIGQESKKETLFTRYEFEFELNCIVSFLKTKKKNI